MSEAPLLIPSGPIYHGNQQIIALILGAACLGSKVIHVKISLAVWESRPTCEVPRAFEDLVNLYYNIQSSITD
jgi:hypothetical protein